jgi:hypothetical protein
LLVPIALLGGDAAEDEGADLSDPTVRDELSRAAADAVLELLAHRKPT